MINRTDSIKAFLNAATHPDLAALYNEGMEVQVNVAQDNGERIEGEYLGKKWQGFTDGLTTWKSFRIPRNANTEPEYTDTKMAFDLGLHAEAIGMTGWDWKERVSKWVAFDFDAIVGHSDKHAAKLAPEELEAVKKAALGIPWVTVRRSTSGKGLHLYVFLADPPTQNHNEHAALGRAILGMMSALAGFDFHSKVDACGGNMWVWGRKMKGTDGLSLIKQGSVLQMIPPNWRDHLIVVRNGRQKNLPAFIEQRDTTDIFDELTGQRPRIPLDDQHKAILEFLQSQQIVWWWDADHHMLVTHTHALAIAHQQLGLRGLFKTIAPGTDLNTQNCFLFPMRRGAWSVRRYSPGIQEHESWDQDSQGWTRCFFNRDPDFKSACKSKGGLENIKGQFVFQEAEIAFNAAKLLGVSYEPHTSIAQREATMSVHKDGRLLVEIEHRHSDSANNMGGWLLNKQKWIRFFNIVQPPLNDNEVGNYDDAIRHLVTSSNDDYGWAVKREGSWGVEPLAHVKPALASLGINAKDITSVVGASIFRPWMIVNKPFQPEYPGDRQWNLRAAQLKYLPDMSKTDLSFPTWMTILRHVGAGLDEPIKRNVWCKANGIQSGADYLKLWISSLLKEPMEPLPYLFFYGPENSGKSIFHEALALLLTGGYKRADSALTNQQTFNAELEGAIVCVVEEVNIAKHATALNRIKDWVTSREVSIHRKGMTPYSLPNTWHWIQTANDPGYCPVFAGDTRITMVYVPELDPMQMIPKKQLIPLLQREAVDFVTGLMQLELPVSNDRLNLPIIETSEKRAMQHSNQTSLVMFVEGCCKFVDGALIHYGEFCGRFLESIPADERKNWTKQRIGKELLYHFHSKIIKGRSTKNAQWYLGNIAWADYEPDKDPSHVAQRLVYGGSSNEMLVHLEADPNANN